MVPSLHHYSFSTFILGPFSAVHDFTLIYVSIKPLSPFHVLNRIALLINYNDWLQLTLRIDLTFCFPKAISVPTSWSKREHNILSQPKIIHPKRKHHRKTDSIQCCRDELSAALGWGGLQTGIQNSMPSWWCCSVAKLCPTVCNPEDCSTPGFPILHYLLEFLQTHVLWVSDAIQPSHSLSPPSSLALNLLQHQGLFQWTALHIRWPKYGSFSISTSNEYSGFISFRIDWFDLLAIQGTLKSLLQHHNSKASILGGSALWSNSHILTWLLEKP